MNKKSKLIRCSVDRIENDFAVLELDTNTQIIYPVKFLPLGIKSGTILDINININQAAEKKQKEKIKEIQERLRDRKS